MNSSAMPPAPPRLTPAPHGGAAPAHAVSQPTLGRPARLGFDGARAARPGAGTAGDLRASGRVLPELEPEAAKRRRLWRHPAFLVSIITTLLAVIAAVVLLVLGVFSGSPGITELTIERTEGNIRVHWAETADPVELFAVGGPSGEVIDLSQTITGNEAWIPLGALLVDDGTCIVVRPLATTEADTASDEPSPQLVVSLDSAALEEQGAASACVADAVPLTLPESEE